MGAKWSGPAKPALVAVLLLVLLRTSSKLEKKKWQDSTMGIWLIENSCPPLIAAINLALTHTQEKPEFSKHLILTFFGGLLTIDGIMLVQHFLVNHVYKHKPWFVDPEHRVPQYTWKQILWDYVRFTLPTQLLASTFVSLATNSIPADQYPIVAGQPFRLFPFIFRYGLVRLFIDVAFYVIHRLIHTPLLYSAIHKQHHEYVNTTLFTNYHFTIADLFLEGFVPVFGGSVVLNSIYNLTKNPLFLLAPADIRLIYSYSVWYEIGSHCGKAMPLSMFPPLAPFYNAVYRLWSGKPEGLDEQNVLFHERHHNLVKCNYGITPWPDWCLGTARLELRKEKDVQK